MTATNQAGSATRTSDPHTVATPAGASTSVPGASTGPRATAAKRRPKRRPKALLKSTSATGGPGDVKITLALTRATSKTLKHRHKVTVNARLTFTPTGGTAATSTAKLTLKSRARARRA